MHGSRKLVVRIDTNTDGQLDRKELFVWLNKIEDKAYEDEAANVFDKEDTDADGYITYEEYMSNSGLPGECISYLKVGYSLWVPEIAFEGLQVLGRVYI